MKSFILMLTFLTRIPIPVKFDIDQEDFQKGIWWMPVIGLIIGLLLFGVYLLLRSFTSPLLLAFLLFLVYVLITGGLHIDGLADTLDAFGSNRQRERMLEIMKDSHIGTFGVLGIVLLCFGMVVLLQELAVLCLFFPIVGRTSALLSCAMCSYAREDGLGKTMISNTTIKHVVFALVLCVLLILTVSWIQHSIMIAWILAPMLITFVIVGLYTKRIAKILGGITGDIIGATIELSQFLFLILSYGTLVILGL